MRKTRCGQFTAELGGLVRLVSRALRGRELVACQVAGPELFPLVSYGRALR